MRFFQTILILLAAFGLLTFFPLSARCQNQEASEVNKRSQPKNIYAKLGLSSRAAATAFAFERELV